MSLYKLSWWIALFSLARLINKPQTSKKLLALVALPLCFFFVVSPVSAFWEADNTINNSLPDVGIRSHASVFLQDNTWYMIAGAATGDFSAFNWTGSAWQPDSGINASLPNVDLDSKPNVFFKDNTWYMIAGNNSGFWGFNWTGSAWQADSGINASLPVFGGGDTDYSISVFFKDGTWYAITGQDDGLLAGFNWTGSAWQADSGINASLPDIGSDSLPNVFFKDGTWYLITKSTGFNWTGSAWQADSGIVSGLPGIGLAAPNVFQRDSELYMIAGNADGTFNGFKWNENTTVTTPTITSPTVTTTTNSSTIILNATIDSDTCMYWFNDSDLITDCQTPINNSQIVGWWPFDSADGNSWISNHNISDLSMYSNDGVVFGVEYVRGTLEKGLELNGVSSYIDNDLILADVAGNTTGTFLGWVNFNNFDSNMIIFSIGDANAAQYVSMGTDTSGRVLATSADGGTEWQLRIDSGLTANAWYHVALVQDGTSPVIYINGVAVPQTFTNSVDVTKWFSGKAGLDAFNIGRFEHSSTVGQYSNATFDDLRYYTRALTVNEVLSEVRLSDGYYNWSIDGGEKTDLLQVRSSDSYINSTTATQTLTINFLEVALYNISSGSLIDNTMTVRIRNDNFTILSTSIGNNITVKDFDAYIGTKLIIEATNSSSPYFDAQILDTSHGSGENYAIYLVSLAEDWALNTLKMQDLVGTFNGADFEAWGYVGGTFVQLIGDIFDIEDKVVAYYDRDVRYTIYVRNDAETRIVGSYVPDVTGEGKVVTVGTVDFGPDFVQMTDNISYEWNQTATAIVFTWVDIANSTTSVNVSIFNKTNWSQQVFTSLCTNTGVCSITFPVPTLNQSYTGYFQAAGAWGDGVYDGTKGLWFWFGPGVYRINLELPSDKVNWYPGISLSLIIISAMLFRRRHAALNGIASMSVAVFCAMVGWLNFPVGLFAVLLVLALVHAVRKREEVR